MSLKKKNDTYQQRKNPSVPATTSRRRTQRNARPLGYTGRRKNNQDDAQGGIEKMRS